MLAGVPYDVYTDHQALKYFLTKPRLNTRQAAWAIRLADFHFTIHYKAGKETERADALSLLGNGKEPAGSDDSMFQDGQLTLVQGELLEQGSDIEMQEPL